MIVAGYQDLQGGPDGVVVGLTYDELRAMELGKRAVVFGGNEQGPPVVVVAAVDNDAIVALIREYAADLRGEERAQ